MQRIMRWASLGLYAALCLFMLWFGYVYLNVKDMLWFHAAAVPEALRPHVLPLYLALMNLVGSASLAVGGLGAFLLLGPIRSGAPWAATAFSAALAFVFIVAAVTAEELAKAGAPTSWHIMGVLLAANAGAYALHIAPLAGRLAKSWSPEGAMR